MTTEATWYPFPGLPEYEFNADGEMRTIDAQLLELQIPERGPGFYSIPHHEIQNHFIKIKPDDIIDDYLPHYAKE